MKSFFTTEGGEYEYEISKSRFIAICRRVSSDEQASEVLEEIRRKYRDSTHVCYAYISGDGARSSDDGEPAGTAGVPISECIRSANLSETLVAVVRYFGGIKLGTGGLLRAYTKAASEVLALSSRVEVADCDIIKASFEYSVWKKIEKRSFQSLYKLLCMEYNKTVDVTYAVTDINAAKEELCGITQGKSAFDDLGVRRVERRV